jgi:hypothetical protein
VGEKVNDFGLYRLFADYGQFDARPVSLISLSAAAKLSEVLVFLLMIEDGKFYVLG